MKFIFICILFFSLTACEDRFPGEPIQFEQQDYLIMLGVTTPIHYKEGGDVYKITNDNPAVIGKAEIDNEKKCLIVTPIASGDATLIIEDVRAAATLILNIQVEEKEMDDNIIQNIRKRAYELRDVKWKALGNIPTVNDAGGCKAGEHVGIIYSSCMEVDKFVGFDITLYTFLTAANNPYSLLYTEDIMGTRSKSAYGFTYHGTNCGAYMGIVCNVYVQNAIGQSVRFDTGSFNYCYENRIYGKVSEQSAQSCKIGDMLWEKGHCMVITNVWQNSIGEIVKVECSHSTFNYPQSVVLSAEEFDNQMKEMGKILYRYIELYENKQDNDYNCISTNNDTYCYAMNDDICTFAGDKAAFRQGQIIALNYNLKSTGDWNEIELYKDDKLLGTYPISKRSHTFMLTDKHLGYGNYKARLKRDEKYSDFTYFEIIEAEVSVKNSIVYFNSANGKPLYISICTKAGRPKATYKLTQEDITNGYCYIDFERLVKSQYNNGYAHNSVYLKVYFVGKYGRITSDYILIH